MRVMEGTSFTRPTDGKWVKLEIDLHDVDLLRLLVEWGSEEPEQLSARIRLSLAYDILSAHAQLLLALRTHQEGVITLEELQVRMRQLAARQAKHKSAVGLVKE